MTSFAIPFYFNLTASSTAISQKGLVENSTLAKSTPEWSALTRIFAKQSTTLLTPTRTFIIMDRDCQVGQYTYNSKFCVGEGAFGKVYQGTSRDGRKVAIKKVDLRVLQQDSFLQNSMNLQIELLKKFDHPNIVRLYDTLFTKNNVYMVTQFCEGGDLKEYCRSRKLDEQQIASILRDVVRGMKALSQQKIVHRDLKPANIFMSGGVFKIGDFGFARKIYGVKVAQTIVGTPMYMSPQLLLKEQSGPRADIWSFGVLAYQSLFGHLPWTGRNEAELVKSIQSRPLKLGKCGELMGKLIEGCLQFIEQDRLSWRQLSNMLEEQGRAKGLADTFRVGKRKEAEDVEVAVSQVVKLSDKYFSDSSQAQDYPPHQKQARAINPLAQQQPPKKATQRKTIPQQTLSMLSQCLTTSALDKAIARHILNFLKAAALHQLAQDDDKDWKGVGEGVAELCGRWDIAVVGVSMGRGVEGLEAYRGQYKRKAVAALEGVSEPAGSVNELMTMISSL